MNPRLRKIVLSLIILAGLGLFIQGSWIQAKALLAQQLLHIAWQETLKDGQQHKPWPWADHWPVARLIIEDHEVDQIVLSGDSGNVLAFAPGHNRASGLAGHTDGITIISGHRDTHFAFLKNISKGQKVQIKTAGKKAVYRVREMEIVDSRNTRIDLTPDHNSLLLVTCYPFDSLTASGPWRYVVSAEAVNSLH